LSRDSSSRRSCVAQRLTHRGNWPLSQIFQTLAYFRRAFHAAKSLRWTWIRINLTHSMVCEQFPPKPLKTIGREKRKSLQTSTYCDRKDPPKLGWGTQQTSPNSVGFDAVRDILAAFPPLPRPGVACMNFLRMTALTALLLCSTWILADDPRVHVDDPTGSFTPVGLSFSFTSNASGGGAFNFTNASGVAFTSLEINVAAPMPPGPITCGGNAFASCFQQSLTEGGFATIDFSGGPGIANGAALLIELGSGGWTPNATFTAVANETNEPEVPEPGMLTLFASGIGALWLRNKSSTWLLACPRRRP